ncbi:flagellar assembly factor FliW [Scopulibacillus daqui]|uniref:Flagellar assembly factor FliW n=1 Tax=Scopulibacillus daqui TaxID=1469162 RepID=A0ABS2Q020_9BACL|nr:flagellar assembly protein FliW [Scopulibacillus daqui]MBM7645034.1 flagellar assembly factor FliW [Scopulibacillus daqui]
MEIKTKYLGIQTIKQEDIIAFPNGIPGFLEEKQFVVLPFAEGAPFHILQSIKTPNVAFIVVPPFIFFKDYQFEIPNSLAEQLNFQSNRDVNVYSIVTVKEPFETSTINLCAPVLINSKQQIGKQVVLNNDNYKIRQPLLQNQSAGQER